MAHEEAEVRWIDCNIGSRLTMKYPGVILLGRKARAKSCPLPWPTKAASRHGAKMVHAADETSSSDRQIHFDWQRAISYRGLVQIPGHLKHCRNNTECDALLINRESETDTYPAITSKAVKIQFSTRQAFRK